MGQPIYEINIRKNLDRLYSISVQSEKQQKPV